MPESWSKISFGLSDYFSRYGFDEGREDNVGEYHKQSAVEILNKHLQPFGISVEPNEDGTSSSNNCRIQFVGEEFQDIDSDDWTNEDVWAYALDAQDKALKRDGRISRLSPAENRKKAKQLNATLDAASLEFEEAAKDNMSRVMSCLDKDLPLLVGYITDEDAIKILEWRLKGAS